MRLKLPRLPRGDCGGGRGVWPWDGRRRERASGGWLRSVSDSLLEALFRISGSPSSGLVVVVTTSGSAGSRLGDFLGSIVPYLGCFGFFDFCWLRKSCAAGRVLECLPLS